MEHAERGQHNGGFTATSLRRLAGGSGAGGDRDLAERRELNNGFGNALSRAFELAVTPAIFGFLGWLLDGAVGTRPLFLVTFFLIVAVYMMWKLFVGYDAAMKVQEQRLLGNRDQTGGDDS